MAGVVNLSAYKFAPLDDLPALKERLQAVANARALKGTILLSTEGINLFVAGERAALDGLLAEIRRVPGLAGLTPKESLSDEQPFNRMLVKIKKEIIAFGVEGIDPARRPAPRLDARTLKAWLDEGRPVTLLDTRNDYEVKMGTFRGAVVPGIENFRDFPASVARLPAELKDRPVVTFCTGGILKYFEECGAAHYEGECFVFDRRVGVDPALQETNSVMCFACQMPLTEKEQQHPHYVPDRSCPHCFVPPAP